MISCVDGKLSTTLCGDRIVAKFIEILNNDVDRRYPVRRRNHNSLIGSRGLVIQHNHRTLRRIPAGIGHSELNQVQSRPFHKVDGRLRIGRDLQDRGLFAALHDRVKILQGAAALVEPLPSSITDESLVVRLSGVTMAVVPVGPVVAEGDGPAGVSR